MKGIREYMGWSDIPDLDSANTGSDDNPFSGPKAVTPGKVSVQMPTEDWLCKKIGKLNLTLVEGYPSRSSEAGGLLMAQRSRNPGGMGLQPTTKLTLLLSRAGVPSLQS